MRKLAAALCVAVCASLTLVPATEAAAAKRKPPYGVTVTAPGTAVVGTAVTVSGKVSGKGAGRSRVAVQVRYGSAAWRTVATPRTTGSGAYSVKVSLAHAGSVQLRTVKSASKFRRAGASRAVTLLASRWIDLTTAPSLYMGMGPAHHGVTIGGRRFATSVQSGIGALVLGVQPRGACSTLEFWTGFADREADRLTPEAAYGGLVLGGSQSEGEPDVEHGFDGLAGPAVKHTVPVSRTETVLLQLETSNGDGGATLSAVLAAPRMLCTVDALGELDEDLQETPPFIFL